MGRTHQLFTYDKPAALARRGAGTRRERGTRGGGNGGGAVEDDLRFGGMDLEELNKCCKFVESKTGGLCRRVLFTFDKPAARGETETHID